MIKLIIAFLLVSQAALAAGGAHIPTGTILVQLLNIVLFAGLLIYLLRKKVKTYFAEKKEDYLEAVNKAEKLKVEADAEKKEIEAKIASFKNTNADEIAKAKAEAEALKQSIVEQAKSISATIEREASKTVENEMVKAKARLRESLLEHAIGDAKAKFSSISNDDHRKMNQQFVDGLGAN